jgi:hypothetical protein
MNKLEAQSHPDTAGSNWAMLSSSRFIVFTMFQSSATGIVFAVLATTVWSSIAYGFDDRDILDSGPNSSTDAAVEELHESGFDLACLPLKYPARFLLSDPLIAQELGLTEQTRREFDQLIQTVLRESVEGRTRLLEDVRHIAPGDRERLLKRHSDLERAKMTALDAALLERLSLEQRRRLSEVNLQLIGIDCLVVPALRRELGIDDLQERAINELRAKLVETGKDLEQRFRGNALSAAEHRMAIENAKTQFREQVRSLLSESQLGRLQELQGRPVSFTSKELRLKIRLSAPQ